MASASLRSSQTSSKKEYRAVFSGLVKPENLVLREGCAIVMKVKDGKFVGATGEKSCGSTLRGASYATSEVEIGAELLVSWDRGWDSEDQHVWGAEKGGYHFKKVKNYGL